ncbi:murein L,D-transpeptidase [Neisseriaceae bacterium B1]
MRKVVRVAVCAVALLGSFQAAADVDVEAYKQSKKVIVNTQTAELCFVDTQDCHPVLIGKTTPKGTFDMTIYATDKIGYGGDVIGFKMEKGFLFALHRVWTRKPSERRLERIASDKVSDRIMTNGCINVQDEVYDRLKQYFVLEIV